MLKVLSLEERRLIKAQVLLAGIAAACLTLPRCFCFALPPSLSHILFWADRDTRKISRGDYVLYPHSDIRTGYKSLQMVKKVVCNEGDILTVDSSKRYFCNGVYLGEAKDKAIDGAPLTNFIWNGPVPAGMVLAMGECKDSYDGRYYGFVQKTAVINKAHPVF
jgi:type IV secretory pathway protease TraF